MKELKLMKGNEALAEAAIRAGCDAYFGYPITPQSEVLEYLSREAHARTGMIVLQAESEVASINMVYGAAGTGKKIMTSSSSPGMSLMQEGISYIACAELPCLLVNVNRGGPEMSDFVKEGFELAFKYRNPVLILTDGALGQMMEKVELFPQQERKFERLDWALTGKPKDKPKNVITSLNLKADEMEITNLRLQAKYREIEKNEIKYEAIDCEDADYIITAYGLVARICTKAAQMAREKGIKVGVLRPISLFPFPYHVINDYAGKAQGILDVEMNAGQMVEDVRLAVNGKVPVEFYGRMGGIIPAPDEILKALEEKLVGVTV